MPDGVEVHHESPVLAGLVIVPSGDGGEDVVILPSERLRNAHALLGIADALIAARYEWMSNDKA